MVPLTEKPQTLEKIIELQKAKLERVLNQVQPGLAIEIIRYCKDSRILVSHPYDGEDLNIYKTVVRQLFNDACEALKEGQNLRTQLLASHR